VADVGTLLLCVRFGLDARLSSVTTNQQNEIAEIEATQAALRDSIEATKGLAARAETLLQQHKRNLENGRSKN
jgi:ABC-type transporter Mla subunit MlaD